MLFDFKTLHQANLLQPELGGGLLLSGMLNNEIALSHLSTNLDIHTKTTSLLGKPIKNTAGK